VVASRIHPVKVTQPEPILDKLQGVLKGTPPPWLRKAVMKDQAVTSRFDDEDDAPAGAAPTSQVQS
jgi:nitrogen fixation protein NifX